MLTIAFGSQSGNARNLAFSISEQMESAGIDSMVVDMADFPPEEIPSLKKLLVVTSTFGDGEPPDNASEWMSFLKFSDELVLPELKFAVIGLGDTYYPHFCQCSKDFDQYLSKRGGHPMVKRLDCDLYYEDHYIDWLDQLINVLKSSQEE